MAPIKDKSPRSGGSGSPTAPAAGNRAILYITLAIIIGVELFIVTGLYERYHISTSRSNAKAAFQKGDYAKALKYYQKLLVIAPLSVPVNEEAADTYAAMGQHDKAIQHYQTALGTDASAKGINAKIGLSQIALGRPAQAAPFFERERALDPQNHDAIFYTGLNMFERGQWRDAGLRFQAVANNPRYKDKVLELTRELKAKAEAAVAPGGTAAAPDAGQSPAPAAANDAGTSPTQTPIPAPANPDGSKN